MFYFFYQQFFVENLKLKLRKVFAMESKIPGKNRYIYKSNLC